MILINDGIFRPEHNNKDVEILYISSFDIKSDNIFGSLRLLVYENEFKNFSDYIPFVDNFGKVTDSIASFELRLIDVFTLTFGECRLASPIEYGKYNMNFNHFVGGKEYILVNFDNFILRYNTNEDNCI